MMIQSARWKGTHGFCLTSATDDEKMMGEVMKMTMMLGRLMDGLRLGEHSHLGNQQLELNKLISVSHFAPSTTAKRIREHVQATIHLRCTGQLIHFKGQTN